MNEHLEELKKRLANAIDNIQALHDKSNDDLYKVKLRGKIEGFDIAMRYVQDYEKLITAMGRDD